MATAKRHGIQAQQIYRWRERLDERLSPAAFLPVSIGQDSVPPGPGPVLDQGLHLSWPTAMAGSVDLNTQRREKRSLGTHCETHSHRSMEKTSQHGVSQAMWGSDAVYAWGMKIARHRGMARARVAVARKLAVILHRMWSEGTTFRFGTPPHDAAVKEEHRTPRMPAQA